LYLIFLVGFMVGSLWAYAAIFALSFEAHGFLPEARYEVYVLLFACVVLPFACVDLADQKFSQSVLAAGRTVMLVVMTTTAGIALLTNGPLCERKTENPLVAGVVAAAPVVAYACTLHHSVPQICAPVDRKGGPFVLNYVFRFAFGVAAAFYLLFSIVIASFFGDVTKAAVNLDWANYHLTGVSPLLRYLGHFLAKFVVLYPAINVVATYPLTAITLGDAFLDCLFQQKSRPRVLGCRLLAAAPPLVGALCVSDISAITRFTGVFGLAMSGVYPGLLALAARRQSPGPTPNTSALNGPIASLTLVVVGALLCLTPLLDALYTALSASSSSWAAAAAAGVEERGASPTGGGGGGGLRHHHRGSFPY